MDESVPSHKPGRVYCTRCRQWGDLVKESKIVKNKRITTWWVVHKKKYRHRIPKKFRPSQHVEVLAPRSLSELKMEDSLQKRGYNFVAQKRIRVGRISYVVDFLVENQLVVECEGRVHQDKIPEDNKRQELLENIGYTVLRFANFEVFDSISICLDKIKKALEAQA